MNPLRKKLYDLLSSRIAVGTQALRDEMVQTTERLEKNHAELMNALQVIANHLNPDLIKQFPETAQATSLQTVVGDVVISPNYGRYLKPDDVFLLSYPRSGNTWMRVILLNILYPPNPNLSLDDVDRFIPSLYNRLPLYENFSSPRVVASHAPYHSRQGGENPHLYKKFIYVIRHPYKVLASFYDYESYRVAGAFGSIEEFIDMVLNNAYNYGTWTGNLESWLHVAQRPDTQALFLRYEDLTKNTIPTIQRIASFLGKPLSTEEAEGVKQRSSQESMIEMEKRGSANTENYEFIRRGTERQSKETLTDALKDKIYAYNRDQMDAWGFGADGSVASDYPMKAKYGMKDG